MKQTFANLPSLIAAGVALLLPLTLFLNNADASAELEVVKQVDLQRYAGKWYEIARYDHSFERNCAGVTAEYSIRPTGKIDVTNRCLKGGLNGKEKLAHGIAWVADTTTNAKLKVQFFWPFRGDYWITELGESYEYAVIGEPSRQYLWILSRTPRMDPKQLQQILSRLPERGYSSEKLIFTEQGD